MTQYFVGYPVAVQNTLVGQDNPSMYPRQVPEEGSKSREYVYFPVQRRNVGISSLSHPHIGSLCSLPSIPLSQLRVNTTREVSPKRKEAALQASTDPCVTFLYTSAIRHLASTMRFELTRESRPFDNTLYREYVRTIYRPTLQRSPRLRVRYYRCRQDSLQQ